MLSNLAASYFNQPLIMQWDPDYCAQARFCELLGVPVPPASRAAWGKSNAKRMESTIKRRTEVHKVKVALWKKGQRARKQEDARLAKGNKDSYKSERPPLW
jgi:hypothetical protein